MRIFSLKTKELYKVQGRGAAGSVGGSTGAEFRRGSGPHEKRLREMWCFKSSTIFA